jgi:acyl-CoA synthetase (AMP-forming)/AMP-acid ligase II
MAVLQRHYLEESARHRTEEVALRSLDDGETMTYGELDEAANRFANALHDRGMRQGDRVCLALYNTVEFPVALYACHKRGFVPVALNYRFAEADFEHAFTETNPEAVVYDAAIAETVTAAAASADVETTIIVGDNCATSLDALVTSGTDERPPPFSRGPEDVSYMFNSTGTTGDPMTIVHKPRSCRNWIHA